MYLDILVAALEEVEDLRHSVRHAELVDLCLNLRDRTGDDRLEIVVDSVLIRHVLVHDLAAEILVAHRNRAVHKVAERIGKLGVPSLDHEVVGDHTVILKRHLVDAEIADRIDIEYIGEIVGVNDISLGLRHLAAGLQEPRMTEDLLRERLAERHQEDRPVNGMEADDVLADKVKIRPSRSLQARRATHRRHVSDRSRPEFPMKMRFSIRRGPAGPGAGNYSSSHFSWTPAG